MIKVGGIMIKKALIGAFLLVFGVLVSGLAYAGTSGGFGSSSTSSQFDVSIDRVSLNNQVVSQSKNNLLNDADVFAVQVGITAVKTLDKGHVEVSLRGRKSNDAVADSTAVFDLLSNKSITQPLTLSLTDGLKRENDFELVVKVADAKGRSEQKTYGIRTKQATDISKDTLDISIDRVRVNNKVVAESSITFIDEKDEFDVLVDLTALENIVNARVEAVLKDINTGDVVADATPNFNLADNANAQKSLKLALLDRLKRSNDFELTIKVIDAEGDFAEKIYGITMKGGKTGAKQLDVSFDKVEVENKVVMENEGNFVVTGEGVKKLDVEVSLTSLESIENARLEAILMLDSGDVVSDVTPATFDIATDQKISKNLELELPGKFKQDSFRMILRLADAEGNVAEKTYGLNIMQQKFPFVVSLISLTPEKAQAGKSLGIKVSFRNAGVLPLDGLFAKASIEELGLSSTKYIDPLKNDGKELISEDFIIKIPETANPGVYTLSAEIGSQLDTRMETKKMQFEIAGRIAQAAAEEAKTATIKVPVIKQDMPNDGTEVVYALTVTNDDAKSNAYALSLDGNEWAGLRMNEPSAFVLGAKESKTLNIYASTNKDLAGEQVFYAAVKSNEKVLREIAFKANVLNAGSPYTAGGFKTMLQAFLILAVFALVGAGVYFGLQSIAKKENDNGTDDTASEIPDVSEGKAYY